MTLFKKLATISAVYGGLSYIGGIFVYLQLLKYDSVSTPSEQLAIIGNNPVLVHITTLHIYILFSFGIILLATYLYLKLKDQQPALGLLSLISGVVWSTLLIASGFISMGVTAILMNGTAVSELTFAWQAIDIVSNALGGGNELIGGVFTGLLSLALYKARYSSLVTSLLGVVVFVGGIISALPYLADVGIGIFVISQILWFFSLARDITKL
ncbi:hypothetical protein KC723_00200 [Candidatus Kaiserbacteria bacterium]|nr:hypothetical protein [Candidatus Kaiserbacteria bacterium]